MNKFGYPSVVERYFTKYFYKFLPKEDVCVLAHSNKVCVVTISPSHQALSEGPIKKVSFVVNGKNLATENRVQGKKKTFAIKVSPKSTLCVVTSGSGKQYEIKCGVKGQLLEVNERLMTNPTLLNTKFQTDGYIAIINHNRNVPVCENLLTEEEYKKNEENMGEETKEKVTKDTEGQNDKEEKEGEEEMKE